LSGFCADGLCCESACDGQCEKCGTGGLCIAVTGNPVGARNACASDGSKCGGTCDGTSRAPGTYPGSNVPFRAPSCTNDVGTLVAVCDGAGACPALQTQDCKPLTCGVDKCLSDCASDAQCQTGFYCDLAAVGQGICKQKVALGSGCTVAHMCT